MLAKKRTFPDGKRRKAGMLSKRDIVSEIASATALKLTLGGFLSDWH